MTRKYLYAIHAPSVKRVKIGSSVDPYDRLRNLQVASPVELVMYGCKIGTSEEEKKIHRKYARLRVIGEWFDDSILKHLDFGDPPPPARKTKSGHGGVRGRSMTTPVDKTAPGWQTALKIDLAKLEAKKTKLIDKAQEWAQQNGGVPPTASDWKSVRGTGWPSYLTCIRAFGSWDDFIIECGWEPRGRGRPIK